MKVKRAPDLRDLHTVNTTLATGIVRTYRYNRKTRRRIYSQPGDPGFVAELRRAGRVGRGEKRPPVTPEPEKRKRTGYVYFAAAHELGLVKIGWATNVSRRLCSMQSGCPVDLALLAALPAVPVDEARLHGRFAHLRVKREWFRLTDEITAYLAADPSF